jgi:hypothetical protein
MSSSLSTGAGLAAAATPRAAAIIAAHGGGVSRALRRGSEWQVEPTTTELPVRCLSAGPGGEVWAGTQGAGVYRSPDGGASWQPAGLAGRIVKAVAPSPHDVRVVYAGLKPASVWVTRDGGGSWSELEGFRRIRGRRFWLSPAESPGTAYVQGLGVSPTNPDLLVAGIEFGAVVRSSDGGATWSGHRPGAIRDCHSLTFHATDGDRVYEGGAGWRRPLAASRDGGESWWSPPGAKLWYGWSAAADPVDADTMYVSAARGPVRAHGEGSARAVIYRSRGGGPWEALSGGLPTPLDGFPYALLTDPGSPGHLYAGLSTGDVWFSADHGDRWAPLPFQLPASAGSMIALW